MNTTAASGRTERHPSVDHHQESPTAPHWPRAHDSASGKYPRWDNRQRHPRSADAGHTSVFNATKLALKNDHIQRAELNSVLESRHHSRRARGTRAAPDAQTAVPRHGYGSAHRTSLRSEMASSSRLTPAP